MAEIQLSGQLLNEMQTVVQRHHPDADPAVMMQYLAAVMGYMLANQPQIDAREQGRYLEELCEFARQVHQDVTAQRQQREGVAQQSAYGIWEPGK